MACARTVWYILQCKWMLLVCVGVLFFCGGETACSEEKLAMCLSWPSNRNKYLAQIKRFLLEFGSLHINRMVHMCAVCVSVWAAGL